MLCTIDGYNVREPVEVRILKDRIEITSYPGLERTISVFEMQKNNIRGKKYRNRRIGDFLKELKLTEGRNTGIPKIKRELKNNGSPDPLFESDEDRTYFITTIFIHEGFKNIKTGDKIEETGDKIEETGDKIEETGDKMEKTGDKIEETGDKMEKTGDKIEETGDKMEKTGDKMEETGDKMEKTGDKMMINCDNRRPIYLQTYFIFTRK